MDKIIILGLIGYLIYSNLPDPTTEPPLQTVTDRENLNPATTTTTPAIVSNLDEQNIFVPNYENEIFKDLTGNNQLTPPNLEFFNRYEKTMPNYLL